MTLTRATVEQILIKRVGGLMAHVDLDGDTSSGQNADLNDAIGWAARQVDAAVTDPGKVTDADLSGVSSDDYDMLFDLAEYRQLQSLYNAMMGRKVPSKDLQGHAFLVSALARRIAARLLRLQQDYGFAVGQFSGGVVDLAFTQQHEDTE